MRLFVCLLALGAGIVLATATTARADSPQTVNYDFHHPNDLKAYTPPGAKPGADGEGNILVEPPRPLDPALLNDPKVVKWPTLDKSEWVRYQSQYKIVPRD